MTEKRGSRGGVYDPTLSVRTPATVRRALEAYAASYDITLSKASSVILEDWLRTHGWMVGSGQKPTGPATDVIEAMDEAIKKDRTRRKSARVASVKETGEELPQEEWERFEAVDKKPKK